MEQGKWSEALRQTSESRHAPVRAKLDHHHHRRHRRRLDCRADRDGGGFGLIGDFIVGIIGAFIGDYLLNHFHVMLAHGIVGLVINAVIGAVILLFILRLVGIGTGGYGRRRL